MATQWTPGPLHPKVRVPLFQEVSYALDFHSVGVSEYAQEQESLSDSRATNKAFFILER